MAEMSPLSTEILASTERKMTRSLGALERDLQQLRVGGA
jgi:ribosome recycling factor